jgi:long-subunit fatty acid transport protein
VIADRAILALDWELTWYNKIGTRGNYQTDIDAVRNESQELYKPAHTFRAGFEYLLSDVVSIRAGGAYMMDFMRSTGFDPGKSDNPAMRDGFNVTAGLGFNIGRNGYFDIAYVYNRARMTDYDLWYYEDGNGIASQYNVSGGQEFDRAYTSARNRHMITLTLGNRF